MTEAVQHLEPEVISYEPLTVDTYNELLTVARGLHFGARMGDHYGDFEVKSHTDQQTFMDAPGDRGTVFHGAQLIIEDTPSSGVLLRSIRTKPYSPSAILIKEKAVLLNSFAEQPKTLAIDYLDSQEEHQGPLLGRINARGTLLDERAATLWTAGLRELQSERHLMRLNRIAELAQRLVPKIW